MWMRGGASKGGHFLAEDLPQDVATGDDFPLDVMGSLDKLQIDGMGGADPLTSKVAVVSRLTRPAVDVDYLFQQAFVDRPIVADAFDVCSRQEMAVDHGFSVPVRLFWGD
jgi:4-oxalomesaconate tautomerase